MKYFTPELYVRINSPDLDVVEKAHAKWEEALERYGKHLSEIRSRMTPATRKLANSLSLHDAEVLLFKYNGKLAFAELRQGDTHVFLVYLLAKNPLVTKIRSWPFSSKAVRWRRESLPFEGACGRADSNRTIREKSRVQIRPSLRSTSCCWALFASASNSS